MSAATPATPLPPMKLAGLEPVQIGDGTLFVNIGERTNITGSRPDSFIGGAARGVAALMHSPVISKKSGERRCGS